MPVGRGDALTGDVQPLYLGRMTSTTPTSLVRRLLRRLALMGMGVLFALILLEVALRLVMPARIFSMNIPLRPHITKDFELQLDGVSNRCRLTTNRWGLRGEEPPRRWDEAFTIITVGGSTTFCSYLNDDKTWPALLQTKLRARGRPETWVGNAGANGQTSRSHLILMEDIVAKARPDMTIFLMGINDVMLNVDNSRAQFDEDNPYRRSWKVKLYAKSYLVQQLFDVYVAFFHKSILAEGAVSNLKEQPFQGTRMTDDQLVAAMPHLGEYQKNLERLIKRCKELGIRPLFMTQPLLFEDNEHWRTVNGMNWTKISNGPMAASDMGRMMDRYNSAMKQLCQQNGVECLDLAAIVPRTREYFFDLCHVTEKGAELEAETIQRFLEKTTPTTR